LLAHRNVRSVVFDARSVEQATRDRRLLALSLGSLQTLRTLAELPADALAPIRTVIVSSVGQFGRAVIGDSDVGAEILGATIRYGDLIAALSLAAAQHPLISVHRSSKVTGVRQVPTGVLVEIDSQENVAAPLALSAEGFGNASVGSASQAALVADVEVTGLASGQACERFTRDGPLALLPLPTRADAGARVRMALVWCMPLARAERRNVLSDGEFINELQTRFADRTLRVVAVQSRMMSPLHQQARDHLVEHRVVYLGNAAQTLHPVAGQGLNLGLRDGAVLADKIGAACASGIDPVSVLPSYVQSRKVDRATLVALTRATPAFFSTRFAPVALARSIGLAVVGAVPNLRREFARLLMFGVRF